MANYVYNDNFSSYTENDTTAKEKKTISKKALLVFTGSVCVFMLICILVGIFIGNAIARKHPINVQNTANTIYTASVLLSPFLTEGTKKVLDMLNCPENLRNYEAINLPFGQLGDVQIAETITPAYARLDAAVEIERMNKPIMKRAIVVIYAASLFLPASFKRKSIPPTRKATAKTATMIVFTSITRSLRTHSPRYTKR